MLLDPAKYYDIGGIEVESNTVKCYHLIATGFLRNNDTNVNSCYFCVNVTTEFFSILMCLYILGDYFLGQSRLGWLTHFPLFVRARCDDMCYNCL